MSADEGVKVDVRSTGTSLPGRAVLGFGLLLSIATLVVFLAHRRSLHDPRTPGGLRVLGEDVGGLDGGQLAARLRRSVDRVLDEKISLVLGGEQRQRSATRRQLGLRVDLDALVEQARAYGRSGRILRDVTERMRARHGVANLLPELRLDASAARDALVDLKDEIDRAAVDAHLDLDAHRVTPEQPGCLLKVYDALVAVGYLARAGVDGPRTMSLGTSLVPARVSAARLAEIDISTVLGSWETHYSSVGADSDRTYNLKVGADHLNGHILQPGELFSFNEVVGDRTEKEGYRVAPVISGGELIDGLAGGMCQIASTLHAAAFFGGLEIVVLDAALASELVHSDGPRLDGGVSDDGPQAARTHTTFPLVMHYTGEPGRR